MTSQDRRDAVAEYVGRRLEAALREMAPATVQWGLCNVDGRDCATPVRKLRCQVAVIATNVRNEASRQRAVREGSLRELEAVREARAEQCGSWRSE